MRSLLTLIILAPAVVAAASPAPVPAVADSYVREALEKNLGLHAQTLALEQAQARLTEARSAYQPRLDLLARYTLADGGRTIDVPTGDLLNGAYRTLNNYLQSQGGPTVFPQIDNQSIPLLRDHEQETKLRLTQPLYRPEIARGVKARRAAAASRAAQLAAYRRELRLAVLTAYYHYLQADSAIGILDATAQLTAEAVRVNRLLAAADKITDDRVLRAEADDLAIQQQRAEAERDRHTAEAYFNTLLDRPLDTGIERAADEELQSLAGALLADESPRTATPDRREELQALEQAVVAARASESAVRARSLPTLALAVEGGVQGVSYRTGHDADFVQGSLVGELNIWDGRQRKSQLEQARMARREAELALETARQQLALQLQQAGDDFTAAQAACRAASGRREAASEAFNIVSQREREGLVDQLNFLDARTEFTRAELNHAIIRQRLFIAAAALDRAAAESPLPKLTRP